MHGNANTAELFRFLFRLVSRAQELTADEFLRRLVVGIANRYGAASCSVCRFGPMRRTVWAAPDDSLAGLSESERAYLKSLDGRLVQHAAHRREFVSALDIGVDGDIHGFLDEHLPHMDIFAFPLIADETVQGVLVLYLPIDATPLGDADVQALLATAEALRIADATTKRDAPTTGLVGRTMTAAERDQLGGRHTNALDVPCELARPLP